MLRAVVLRQREGVSVSSSLATIVVERVFDGLVMLLFVFVALPFAPLASDSIRFVVILGSLLFLGALLVFLAVAAVPARFLRLAEWFIGRFVPHRLRAPLLGFAERFVEGLLCLRDPRNLVMIFLTSVVIWLLETVKYWFVMHAFNFNHKTVALLGLSFKKRTNDMRDSAALRVVESLLSRGVGTIRAYDPLAADEARRNWFNPDKNHLFERISYHSTAQEAMSGSDALYLSLIHILDDSALIASGQWPVVGNHGPLTTNHRPMLQLRHFPDTGVSGE